MENDQDNSDATYFQEPKQQQQFRGRGGGRGGGGGAGLGRRTPEGGNYFLSHGIHGPWDGNPMSGSLYEAQTRPRGHQSTQDPLRKTMDYEYTNYPVFMLKDAIRPAFSSQLHLERKLREESVQRVQRRIGRYVAANVPAASSSSSSAAAAAAESVVISPLDELEGVSAATTTTTTTQPAATDTTDVVLDVETLGDPNMKDFVKGSVAWNQNGVDSKTHRNYSPDPRLYYHVSLLAPRAYYKDNAISLLDFRAGDEPQRFSILLSFMLQAMSNLDKRYGMNPWRSGVVDSQTEAINNNLPPEMFAYGDRVVPRIRFFVEIVMNENAGGARRHLRPDPATEDEARRFQVPDISVLSQMFQRANIVGFRFHWLIFDPSLHPGSMMKIQIIRNTYEKNIIDFPRLETMLRDNVLGKSFQDYVKTKKDKAARKENDAKQKQARKEQQRALEEQRMQEDKDKGAVPPPSETTPMQAALQAATAVADDQASADQGSEDGDAQVEEEEEDDDEEESSDAQVDGIEEGDPLAPEDEERMAETALRKIQARRRRADAGKELDDEEEEDDEEDEDDTTVLKKSGKSSKKGGAGGADAASQNNNNNDSSAKNTNDPMREKLATLSSEPTPTTFYRLILNFQMLSQFVIHPYNMEAHSQAATKYTDGIYETERGRAMLRSIGYDPLNLLSPLYYLRTFSLDMSTRVAQFHVPNSDPTQQTQRRNILSEQADFNRYYVGAESRFSFPFPALVFEYKPQDARPEFLATYRLPCGSSFVKTMLEDLKKRMAIHTADVKHRLACGTAGGALNPKLFFNHAPTKLFSASGASAAAESSGFREPHHSDTNKRRRTSFRNFGVPAFRAASTSVSASPGAVSQIWKDAATKYSTGGANYAPTSEAQVRLIGVGAGQNGSTQQHRVSTFSSVENSSMMMPGNGGRSTSAKRKKKSAWLDGIDGDEEEEEEEEGEENNRDDPQDMDIAHENFDNLMRAREHMVRTRQIDKEQQLGQVLSEAAGLFSDTNNRSLFSQRIRDKYRHLMTEGFDDVLRQVMETGLSARVSARMADEFSTSLGVSVQQLKQQQHQQQMLAAQRRLCGDHTEETRRQLATTLIEGPIAVLRKQLSELKFELLRMASWLPFKTEVDHLADWLHGLNVDWERPVPRAGETEHAFRLRFEGEVIRAMTFEREEQYRSDMLSRMVSVFQHEASTALQSILHLQNDRLPESLRGMLLFREDRKNDVFYTPRFTFDPTLSRFGNMMAIDLMEIGVMCSLGDGSLQVLKLMWSFRTNAMRHEKPIAQSELLHGPPGTTKSHMMTFYQAGCIQSSMITSDHESRLSSVVARAHDYFGIYYDESQPWVTGAVERMKGQLAAERDMRKGHLSRQQNSFQRNVEGKNKEREKQSVTASYIHQIVMLANVVEPTGERSVLDRFRSTMILPPRRSNDSIHHRVLASKINAESNKEAADMWGATKRDEHYVIGMAVMMQNCLALPRSNTELMSVFMSEIEQELHRWLDFLALSARQMERAFNDAEAMVFAKNYDLMFRSELSPFVQWSRDPHTGAIDGRQITSTSAFAPESLVELFSPNMYVASPEALFACTNYFLERFPLVRFEIIYIIAAEMFNFTPDFFLPSYHYSRVSLPDVRQRARERGLAGDPYEECSFLADFRKLTNKLRQHVFAGTVRNNPKRPVFAPLYRVDQVENLQRNDALARGDVKDKTPGGASAPPPPADDGGKKPRGPVLYCPSVLEYLGSWQQFLARAVGVCQKYFPQIDASTMITILADFKSLNVNANWYEPREREIMPHDLRFRGVEYQYESQREDAKVKDVVRDDFGRPAGIVRQRMQVLTVSQGSSVHAPFVQLSVEFLMRPWHDVLYLALSSMENRHTREYDTVLPITWRKYPEMLHRWRVCKNPHHELKPMQNTSRIPDRIMAALNPVTYQDFGQQLANHSVLRIQERAGRQPVELESDCDVEMQVFRRHLASTFYQPYSFNALVKAHPSAKEDKLLIDWSLERDPNRRMLRIAQTHPNAPGRAEEIICLRRATFSRFTEDTKHPVCYPTDIIQELKDEALKRKIHAFALEAERNLSAAAATAPSSSSSSDFLPVSNRQLSLEQAIELKEYYESELINTIPKGAATLPENVQLLDFYDIIAEWVYSMVTDSDKLPLELKGDNIGNWHALKQRHARFVEDMKGEFHEKVSFEYWRMRYNKARENRRAQLKEREKEYRRLFDIDPEELVPIHARYRPLPPLVITTKNVSIKADPDASPVHDMLSRENSNASFDTNGGGVFMAESLLQAKHQGGDRALIQKLQQTVEDRKTKKDQKTDAATGAESSGRRRKLNLPDSMLLPTSTTITITQPSTLAASSSSSSSGGGNNTTTTKTELADSDLF
jgi:hypothetical protein